MKMGLLESNWKICTLIILNLRTHQIQWDALLKCTKKIQMLPKLDWQLSKHCYLKELYLWLNI